jgi:hypothetical protein
MNFIKYTLIVSLISIVSSCTKFERNDEVLRFLKEEANIKIDTMESFNLFILQDQICGACTNSILSFIYGLDHKNSLVITSNESQILIKQLKNNIGESNVFVDKNRLIERYGLRYAKDLIIIYKKGKFQYYAFLKEDDFDEIKKNYSKFQEKS